MERNAIDRKWGDRKWGKACQEKGSGDDSDLNPSSTGGVRLELGEAPAFFVSGAGDLQLVRKGGAGAGRRGI